jgi:hypothetical protein
MRIGRFFNSKRRIALFGANPASIWVIHPKSIMLQHRPRGKK